MAGGVRLDIDSLIYLAFFTVIGFQAVLFSFLSRVHATQEGLYPPGAGFAGLLKAVTMERGLVAGILISLCGLSLGAYSLLEWQRHGFGLMDFSRLVRLVIPAATALTIGFETVLFSLFFSTLQLSVRTMNPNLEEVKEASTPRRAIHI